MHLMNWEKHRGFKSTADRFETPLKKTLSVMLLPGNRTQHHSAGLVFHSIADGQGVSPHDLVGGSEMVKPEPMESGGWERKTPLSTSPPLARPPGSSFREAQGIQGASRGG